MTLGQLTLLAYAALMLLGGTIGYTAARSKASLLSGAVSAAALIVAWWWSRSSPTPAFALGAVISLALSLTFSVRYSKTGKFMPSGMLLLVSLAALALLAYAAFRS